MGVLGGVWGHPGARARVYIRVFWGAYVCICAPYLNREISANIGPHDQPITPPPPQAAYVTGLGVRHVKMSSLRVCAVTIVT